MTDRQVDKDRETSCQEGKNVWLGVTVKSQTEMKSYRKIFRTGEQRIKLKWRPKPENSNILQDGFNFRWLWSAALAVLKLRHISIKVIFPKVNHFKICFIFFVLLKQMVYFKRSQQLSDESMYNLALVNAAK